MTTAELIDMAISQRSLSQKKRDYLGASMLGEECDRKLWYDFHEPVPVEDPRVQRIFDMGNLIEDYLVELLKDAGVKVFAVDANGEQFGFVDGPVAGHSDGVAIGLPEMPENTPALLEFKSCNAKNFKAFKDKGVRAHNYKYFVQMQVYMRKLNLRYAMFIAMNKDTQELYFEVVELQDSIAGHFILRGKEIAETKELPNRKYVSDTFYKCKFCNHRKKCWEL